MRICDLTMAYAESSGGIRTYIDAKRRHILDHTDHEHLLIAPGADDATERRGRAETRTIKSPRTGHGSYRLLWRPDAIRAALDHAQPDIVELGTFLVCPWPAFAYRNARRAAARPTAVLGFFHTDLADAYVKAPIDDFVRDALEPLSETLTDLGVRLAELAGAGAESLVGAVFTRCDLMLASSPEQADRLHTYGVPAPRVVRMGVDLDRFHPSKRDPVIRARLDAESDDTCLLMYAGRLDAEKHVDTIVDAFATLRQTRDARLVVAGDGPLKDALRRRAAELPGMAVLDFIADKDELAATLASADVYLAAGPHETFGLSVIEAQAAGLPVVGVDSGALVDRVTPGTGYLGAVDDAEVMAGNAARAFDQRHELGAAARAHVEANFGWQNAFERLIEIYETTLGLGAAATA